MSSSYRWPRGARSDKDLGLVNKMNRKVYLANAMSEAMASRC